MRISAALVALAATAVTAVKPMAYKGIDFYNPDSGEKFQIVGMAYQPGGESGYDPKTGKDPLSNAETCLRDAALMQIAGINTVRVYNLDPNLNHDACVSIFNAAGIYMVIDVNSPLPGESLTSHNPWESYYMEYLNRTFAIVEAFSGYPNTLAFFAANEVIRKEEQSDFVPRYVRAVTRDLKNYIKNNIEKKINRSIPVGYSAADVRSVLFDSYNYLQCTLDGDSKDMSHADIFALNSYSWCGAKATFQSSSYDKLVAGFKGSSVPIFFSEYGCNDDPPRDWKETNSIYGSDMVDVFSGGIIYEWTQEPNNYGLVKIEGSTTTLMADYDRLKTQLAKLDWKSIQSKKAAQKDVTAPKCDTKLITTKIFDKNFTIPVVPPGAQNLIDKGINPKPASGKIISISDYNVKLTVKDAKGNEIKGLKVTPLKDDEFNWSGKNAGDTGKPADPKPTDGKGGDKKGDGKENAATLMHPILWAVALPAAAMLFA